MFNLFRCLFAVILITGLLSCENKSELTLSTNKEEVAEKVKIPSWISDDYVMGRFDPETHKDFVEIDLQYADRPQLYLRKDALESFKKMWAKAKKEGVNLQIRSATRNFKNQKRIWENKWIGQTKLSDDTFASDIQDIKDRALKILLYSSMPGTSRHHWGTDIDLNSFSNSYFETGAGLKLYDWLIEHAGDFGFCQPYTSKREGRTGYEEEKWHWSYVPISDLLTKYCSDNIKNEMIQGFEGSDAARAVNVVDNYIKGISTKCLN